MSIPKTIRRDDVLSAMERIRENGVPIAFKSTKFDVLDDNGNPYPPKLVLSTAALIATGQPLSHDDFTGGPETNDILSALGFEVVNKPDGEVDIGLDEVLPGVILSNNQLLKAFGVSNAGGMRWSEKNSHLVIVADHTKSLYEDRRVGEVLHYTGMGRIGDQSLSGQNARLAAQRETGIPVHLFEVFERNKYIYAGRATLAEDAYEESQSDDDGNLRSVFVFPLRLSPDGILPTPRTGEIRKIRAKRERDLLKLPTDRLKDLARQGGRQKPGRREVKTTQYERNEAVVAYVKVKANGRCDLCGNQAPFESKKGPYLECHHIQPLAKGGPDVVENAIALCPNCHRRMHILNLEKDKIRLRKRAKDREN